MTLSEFQPLSRTGRSAQEKPTSLTSFRDTNRLARLERDEYAVSTSPKEEAILQCATQSHRRGAAHILVVVVVVGSAPPTSTKHRTMARMQWK